MAEADLPSSLLQFIHSTLPSYEAAVVLVFLSRDEREWSLDQAVETVSMESIDANAVGGHVEHFVRAGILQALDEGRFRYAPSSEELRSAVTELRTAYDQRPVSLIRAIDAAARNKIQWFADSFKLKRD